MLLTRANVAMATTGVLLGIDLETCLKQAFGGLRFPDSFSWKNKAPHGKVQEKFQVCLHALGLPSVVENFETCNTLPECRDMVQTWGSSVNSQEELRQSKEEFMGFLNRINEVRNLARSASSSIRTRKNLKEARIAAKDRQDQAKQERKAKQAAKAKVPGSRSKQAKSAAGLQLASRIPISCGWCLV